MNKYTVEELLLLMESIITFPMAEKLDDYPEEDTLFSMKNVANIIHQYHKQGPGVISEKINEYAEIGRLTRSGSAVTPPPLVLVYELMYINSPDILPLYLDTPYEPIVTWRLNLSKPGNPVTERS